MFMKLLLTLVPVLFLAGACGGGDGDGLERIRRLNLEGTRYEIGYRDRIVPPIASPYPALVALVNGERITGTMLTLKQVELAVRLQNYPELAEQSGIPDELLAVIEAAFEEADSLELLLDDVLLQQATVRLGYVPSSEEVLDVARDLDESGTAAEAVLAQSSPEQLAMFKEQQQRLGFPEGDTASDPVRIAELRDNLAMRNLRQAECDQSEPSSDLENFDPVRTGSNDCSDFLAEERENSDIEYFVVWAE